MQKLIFFVLIFLYQFNLFASDNYFLMLKNNKVNVRYGPSFDYPIKYIYKKKYLPVEVIDKKENFRKILDHKKKWWLDTYIPIKKDKILYCFGRSINV